MSLDTVLKIGKAFRASTDGLKYFEYIKPCPKDSEKSSVLRLSIPVKEDFTFDFQNITIIDDENIIGTESVDSKLYYLDFKMSDSDTSPKKYLWGDIHYEVIEGKEIRYKTKLGDKDNNSSFDNWSKFYEKKITEELEKISKKINDILKRRKDISGQEEIKSKLLDNSIYKFQNNEIITLFRNSFELEKSKVETLLYNSLIIREMLSDNTFKIDELEETSKLKLKTVKYIFQQLFSDINGRKKLVKAISNKNKDITIENLSWELIENNEEYQNQIFSIRSCNCFLHFDFSSTSLSKKYWYETSNDVLECIYAIFIEAFTEIVKIDGIKEKYVFTKTLYNTLCSGDTKNDIQFTNFLNSKKFKSRAFNKEEVSDLFHAIDYVSRGFRISDDLYLIVLPSGDSLTATNYEEFKKETRKKLEDSESIIDRNNTESPERDRFFAWFDDKSEYESVVTQFDLIFNRKGGTTSPDTYLLELSGISKSSLQVIEKRINDISKDIYQKRQSELKLSKSLSSLSISWSFSNILGVPQADKNGKVSFKTNSKYQSHILKILPRIYTSTYGVDNLLLPSFINNVEYSIRHGDAKYSFLKYDLEFLLSIQNTLVPKQNFLKIMSSKSYELGKSLGKLAIFLKPDKNGDSPINSFEKEFVGNLSRHIGQLRDVQKFSSYLFEKYALHKEKARYIPLDVRKGNVTKEIEEQLMYLQDVNNKTVYDKHECSFGFFASYFAPYEAKVNSTEENETND